MTWTSKDFLVGSVTYWNEREWRPPSRCPHLRRSSHKEYDLTEMSTEHWLQRLHYVIEVDSCDRLRSVTFNCVSGKIVTRSIYLTSLSFFGGRHPLRMRGTGLISEQWVAWQWLGSEVLCRLARLWFTVIVMRWSDFGLWRHMRALIYSWQLKWVCCASWLQAYSMLLLSVLPLWSGLALLLSTMHRLWWQRSL